MDNQQVDDASVSAPMPSVPPTPTVVVIPTMPVAYAGFWLRFTATLIDTLFTNVILALLSFLYFFIFAQHSEALLKSTPVVTGIVYFVVWILYFPFMESRGGATFGKKIVGIKVLHVSGEPVGFLRSLGRNLAKIISALIVMIGFIMAGFTQKKQGLHDMIASCVVVKSREVRVGKIWAVIALILVLCIGVGYFALAKLLSAVQGIFGGANMQVSSNELIVAEFTDSKSVTPAPVVITDPAFDAYLSKPIQGLETESSYKNHTYAGPALLSIPLDFDNMQFNNRQSFYVALPALPDDIETQLFKSDGLGTTDLVKRTNLHEKNVRSWIKLTSVIAEDGKDILDHESYEENRSVGVLPLEKKISPIHHLFAPRRIDILDTYGTDKIKKINGVLFFDFYGSLDDYSNYRNPYSKSYPFTINN